MRLNVIPIDKFPIICDRFDDLVIKTYPHERFPIINDDLHFAWSVLFSESGYDSVLDYLYKNWTGIKESSDKSLFLKGLGKAFKEGQNGRGLCNTPASAVLFFIRNICLDIDLAQPPNVQHGSSVGGKAVARSGLAAGSC